MSAPKVDVLAYDSAYPGSMSPRPDGGYVERHDVASLAGALLERIADLTRRLEDAEAVIAHPENLPAVADLIEAAKEMAQQDAVQRATHNTNPFMADAADKLLCALRKVGAR